MRDAYRLSAPSTELRRRAAGTVPSFCRRRPAQASQPAPYSTTSDQLKHWKRIHSDSAVCLYQRHAPPAVVTFTSFWQEPSKKSFIRDWPMPQFAKRCFALRRLRFFCSRSIGLCCYTGDLCIYVRVDGGCQPVMQTTTPLCSCISLCSTHLDRTVTRCQRRFCNWDDDMGSTNAAFHFIDGGCQLKLPYKLERTTTAKLKLQGTSIMPPHNKVVVV